MSTVEMIEKAMADAEISDYGSMDSLDFLDLCLKLEEILGKSIPDDKLQTIKTRDDLIQVIDGLRAAV